MTAVDINIHTDGVEIPEAAMDLFINGQNGTGGVINTSAVMRLAWVMQIPGAGVKTTIVTGDPKADWVEDSEEKPVDTPTLNTKTLIPYTLAVIVPMSNRFRANKEALANYIMGDLPRVLAEKFDSTVLNGTAPGDGFDVLTNAETVVAEPSMYNGIADAMSAIAQVGGTMNGFAQQLTKELSKVQVSSLGKNIGARLGSSVSSAFDSSGIKTLQQRVSQAEADLTSAMYRSEDAARELLIAEKRLAETRAKHSADSSQVAQAELRVEQAQRKVAASSKSVESAQDRLSQAQRELETETNQATKSVQKQGRAFSSVTGSVAGFAAKIGVISGLTQSVFSRLASVISTRLDSAISRVDTLNNFPKVMANLGYTTGEAEKAMDKLVDAIDGLPTTLDSITSMTQRLAPLCDGLDEATDLSIALNNALLASGSSAEDVDRAMQQYVQALARGKFEMEDWYTLQEVMPAQLDQLAKALLDTTANSNDLYDALADGTISMEDFNDAILKLNDEGIGGFASFKQQAEDATDGVSTSMANLRSAIDRNLGKIIDVFADAGYFGDFSEEAGGALDKLGDKAAELLEKALPVIEKVFQWLIDNKDLVIAAIAGIAAAVAAAGIASLINPVGAVVALIAAIVAGVTWLWQNSPKFREIVQTLWEKLQEFWGWLQPKLQWLWEKLQAFWAWLWPKLQAFWAWLQPKLQAYWETLQKFWSWLWPKLQEFWAWLKPKLKTLWENLKTIWEKLQDIREKLQQVYQKAKEVWDKLAPVREAAKAILKWVIERIQVFIDKFQGFKEWLGSINWSTLLWDAGRGLLQGFWNGMKSIWSSITGWVSDIAGWIKEHKGPLTYDRRLLIPAGQAIMQGLLSGLEDGFKPVQAYVAGMAGQLANAFGGAPLALAATADLTTSSSAAHAASASSPTATYNVYLDGVKIGADGDVTEAIVELVTALNRKYDMGVR